MAEIIQIRDYQNSKDIERLRRDLEKNAAEVMNIALNGHDVAIYESSLGFIAPENDPA